MTYDTLKTLCDSMVKDTLDDTLWSNLLNSIYQEINSSRDWEFLVKLDTSMTAATTDTYLTSHTLPSDFEKAKSVYVGSDYTPYTGIPFEHRNKFQGSVFRYYIDYLNQKLYIIGAPATSAAINLWYYAVPASLVSGGSPVWPTQFHALLAYRVAEIYLSGVDYDDVNSRNSLRIAILAKNLLQSMINWDARVKSSAINYSPSIAKVDLSKVPNAVDDGQY